MLLNIKTWHHLLLTINLLIAIPLSSNAQLVVGQLPPYDDLGKAYDGENIHVSDYQGKIVIVSFWSTECATCMKELPSLAGIQKMIGHDDLQVIAISYRDDRRNFMRLADPLSQSGIQLILDKRGLLAKRYAVEQLPYLVIIDDKGKIQAVHSDYDDSTLNDIMQQIDRSIAAYRGQKPASD